ncbi:ubiquitin-conjugating enzyme E2 T-like [Plodia interpunctella]|uniref:ubiquitin-conjugating enzyme E2 T-like n=1 Tax=Plodia interpunctella TaxID=58824 RepID=UPI00236863FF|nr:ubiquitin-conjugating enzyme E2 T-like [Plodia interpunctella]
MTSVARAARIAREVKNFEITPPWGITCKPVKDDNFDVLSVTLLGPKGSPYENGKFKVTVTIPEKYPFEPPLVKFVTPVYHPNIDKGGRICMDMLKMPPKGAWLPTITLETLLVSLQTLMANPNPDDPLMMDIANEYKHDKDQYVLNAKKYTEKYAV